MDMLHHVSQTPLVSANLGDSGYLIERSGKIILLTPPQEHYFGVPYQLGHHEESSVPRDTQLYERHSASVAALHVFEKMPLANAAHSYCQHQKADTYPTILENR